MATVLLLYPDDPARRLLVRHLERAGHEVAVAADGFTAAGILAGGEVELAVLDEDAPKASGWDVLSRARAERAIPALMLGALAARRPALPAATGWLARPIDPDELSALAAELLRG